MSKRVYISADYSEDSGDRDVVDLLNNWGKITIIKLILLIWLRSFQGVFQIMMTADLVI